MPDMGKNTESVIEAGLKMDEIFCIFTLANFDLRFTIYHKCPRLLFVKNSNYSRLLL